MSAPVDTSTPLVYDAGALVAAQEGSRRLLLLHSEALASGREITVPAPSLAQVWRGGHGQVGLMRVLRGCRIEATDEETAMRAGVLLDRSGTRDVVDAIVVATAWRCRAAVVTSRPEALGNLTALVQIAISLV